LTNFGADISKEEFDKFKSDVEFFMAGSEKSLKSIKDEIDNKSTYADLSKI
jgi:hypothetical protein